MQHILYASTQWTNKNTTVSRYVSSHSPKETTSGSDSNNVLMARSNQYGTVYHKIFKNLSKKKRILVNDSDDSAVKMQYKGVEKNKHIYWLGPYKTKLNFDDSTANTYLRNEIKGSGNTGYNDASKFASIKVEVANGTYKKLVNNKGETITGLPGSDKKFYIVVESSTQINSSGSVKIGVEYISGFDNNVSYWEQCAYHWGSNANRYQPVVRIPGTVTPTKATSVISLQQVEIPSVFELKNTITKNGTDLITDPEEKVTYNIKYDATIKNYKGNANVTLLDKLPYKIDTSKSNIDGGIYDESNNTITWTAEYNNIDSSTTEYKRTIEKNIELVFTNIDVTKTSFTNIVEGQIRTNTPEATSGKVTAEKTTNTSYKINVKAIKKWNDTQEQKSRRPSSLVFMLLADGQYTGKSYTLSPQTKDSEEYTFSNLNKFDSSGKRITYTVIEVTKQIGQNNLRLQDLKGSYITNKDDLRYYVDSETIVEENRIDGNKYKDITITNNYVSMNIKGNIWEEIKIDGKKLSSENGKKGISVKLILEKTNNNKKEYEYFGYNLRTDKNGNYSFNDIPWNGTYKINYTYNGQIYEQTYYKNDLTAGYSNAEETQTERNNLNNRFATITEYPNNYNENKRAYGIEQKIKEEDTNSYLYDSEGEIIKFSKILDLFDEMESSYTEYDDNFYNGLKEKITNLGVDDNTNESLISYIKDCLLTANTPSVFSIDNVPKVSEGSSTVTISGVGTINAGSKNDIASVDYGLAKRKINNISIINDIYKVTAIINGKTADNLYNTKKEVYAESQRANDGTYNGTTPYIRKIYVSDYLYNGEDIGQTSDRNLQLFITYKIRIKNKGNVSTVVNSINSYYDSENLEPIEEIQSLSTYTNNTFVGDSNCNKIDDIDIENSKSDLNGFNEYKKIKITGNNNKPLKVLHKNNSLDTILYPDEETYIYITYKVKNDSITNKIMINKDIKNISEIGSYSTIYMKADENVIPDRLNENDEMINKNVVDTTKAGIIDINSDPGSLRQQDLDDNGNIICKKTIKEKTNILVEDDTDKIDMYFTTTQDAKDVRSFKGFIFEDNRTDKDNTGTASIGNGYYDNDENRINGVTLQLVELVSEIDAEGKQTENYIAEKVWGNYVYKETQTGEFENESDNSHDDTDSSYYSGIGKSNVIITGEGNLKIDESALEVGKGEYSFDSIIPGDYYIRFIYGDTGRTVLTNKDNNEVNVLLNNNGINGNKGLNAKSYNGQDYKSTVYQKNVDQSIIQYNGINGYIDYEKQNDLKVNDKSTMFHYDLDAASNVIINGNKVVISNAKDSYIDRKKCIDYSNNLKNENAEILVSYEKITSANVENQATKQKEMLTNLINNTKMKASTGIMDIEINHNNDNTSNISLGLVERAKSQLILGMGISNVRIELSDGQALFDTSKSVKNLFFSKHQEHSVLMENNRLTGFEINEFMGKNTPELIQAYIDNELLPGAKLVITYQITAKNKGETDYSDKQFYYTGTETKPNQNIVKTKVDKIVVYNTNETKYEQDKQNIKEKWKIVEPKYLLDNNLVTDKYKSSLESYDTLLVSDGFDKQLVPETYNKNNCKQTISLVVSTVLDSYNVVDSMVYNNMSEIINSSNDQGRKFAYTIPGNQKVVSQHLLKNLINGESKEDRIVPEEIDADSAQKVTIMPPTGEYDFTQLILTAITSTGIMTMGIAVITLLLMKNKKIVNENQNSRK